VEAAGVLELERLVAETRAIVDAELPGVSSG
jgi:hypothetical protein